MKGKTLPYGSCARRPLTALLLGSACLVCAMLVGFNNVHRLRLLVNQRAWESTRPAVYYMVVDELLVAEGDWLWAVNVEGGRPTTIKLLDSHGVLGGQGRVRDPIITTIEKAFESGQSCARYVLDCRLDFDKQYHYPRRIGRSDLFEFEVKQFTPYGESTGTCPNSDGMLAN